MNQQVLDEITVLIPYLNGSREDWLKEAIGSLPKGARYLLLRNDGELADALNEGLRQAGTPYVFRLDADDKLDTEALPILYSLIWDVDVAYPTFHYIDENGAKFGEQKAAPFCPHRLFLKNYIPGTCLFRPEKALEVGGYRDMDFGEDWDLWVRMQKAGAKFKGVPEAIYFYRKHGVSRNTIANMPLAVAQQKLFDEVIGDAPSLKASWYHQASFATTYWRCLLPARHLPGQALEWPYVQPEGDDGIHFPTHQGASVWQFPGDAARAVLMSEMQEQGIPVFVESDDSYFDTSPMGNPGWIKKLKASEREKERGNIRGGVHSLEAHRRILRWVDGCIVTTDHLAKRYRRFNANVHVCPNQVDPDDWRPPKSNPELFTELGWKPDDGVFRVGWFASPSHRDDAKLVHRALEWASKQDGVEVVTMGLDPRWYEWPRRHIPWSNDMGVYRQVIGWLDVGLAPVVETPWAVCRSDLKALEYGMAEAAPILSDAIPYRGYDGPCLRARTPGDFLKHVQYLVRNNDEAKALALEAREHVMKHRTVPGNIWRYEEAFASVPLKAAA